MKTIVFSHPWSNSFNKSILDNITKKLDEKKEEYVIIDLYKDGFNPILTEEDLKVYSKGEYTDSLVERYQEILKNTEELILVFPVWWSTMPAMMKGFFDKVMLHNFAYENQKMGIKGLLTNIKSAKVITTATSPKFIMSILGFGMVMKVGILGGIGVKKSKWIHCSLHFSNNDEKRKKFLDKVKNFI